MALSLSVRLGLASNSGVSILGSAQVGAVLSLSPVHLEGASPMAYVVQWYHDMVVVDSVLVSGTPIDQETAATHVVDDNDVGHTIGAVLTDPSGDVIYSSNVITVVAQPAAPTQQTASSITPATGPVGTEFVLDLGTWSGSPTPTLSIGSLTLNGVDVSAQAVYSANAWRYTATANGTVAFRAQASNGVGSPILSGEVTATVTSAAGAPTSRFLTLTDVTGVSAWHTMPTPGVIFLETSGGSVTINDAAIASPNVAPSAQQPNMIVGGYIKNGVMLNPVWQGGQGIDQQWAGWTPANNVTLPVTIVPGDVVVFSKYFPVPDVRHGVVDEYVYVICTSSAPNPAHNLPPPVVSWTGRNKAQIMLECDTVDLDALYDLVPVKFDLDGFANQSKIPTFDTALAKVERVVFFRSQGTGDSGDGYQQFSFPNKFGKASNYAKEIAISITELFLLCYSDRVTRAQFDRGMLAIAAAGKQISRTLIGAGAGVDENGAHGQYSQVPALTYFKGIGAQASIDNFNTSGLMANMRDVVKLDATKVAQMTTPHTSNALPCISRIRPILAIDSATGRLTLKTYGTHDGDLFRMKPDQMQIRKVVAGVHSSEIATITARFGTGGGDKAGTIDVILDDMAGFDVGDDVTFWRPVPISSGDRIWTIDPDFLKNLSGFVKDDYYSLQQMASWVLPLGILGLHNHPLFVDLVDFTRSTMEQVTNPSVGYPSASYRYAAPNDATAAFAKDFWKAYAATLLTPSVNYTAALDPIARDQAILDSGFQRGLSYADFPLTGTTNATDGSVIEIRYVDSDTGTHTTGWSSLGTALAGAFAGIAQVPRAPCWYRAEVRVQGSGAPAAQMANRFAAGHVWSIWEQSNSAKLLNTSGISAGLYDAITYEGDVQITSRGATLGQIIPVTEANKGTNWISPTVVSMANAWAALRGREKLLLVWNTKSGTSITNALNNNAGDGRDWVEDKLIHTTATDIGTQVGAVFVPGWIESPIGFGSAIPEQYFSTFTGKNYATGAKIDIESLWGSANLPRIPAAILADGTNTDLSGTVLDGANGGIYDMRYTRACYFGPHGNNLSLPAASTYPTLASLPSYDTMTEAAAIAGMVANAKVIWDSTNFPEVMSYPGATWGAFRDQSDTLHMDGGDRDGRQRHGLIHMFMMTKALGMHSYPVPVLDGRMDDPAGAYTDMWVTGRNLTTERLRRAAAGTLGSIPATIPAIAPHRSVVMGCCVDKKPVLADIQTASGHPVLPDGQTFLRVYAHPSGPINVLSEVRYGYGTLPGYLVSEDYADRVYLNWLVCDVGQPHAVLPAIPVQFQHDEGLPTTLVAPDLFKVAGTTYLRSTASSIPPGTKAYFEARFRVDAFDPGGMELMGLADDSFVLVEADGRVVLRASTAAWAIAPAGTLTRGVFRTLGFVVDRTVGSAKYEIIDVTTGAILATQATVPTGAFSSGRVNFFSRGAPGNAQFNGTFEYARIWQNMSAPSGNPTYAVEAIAGAPHYATPYGALQLASYGPIAPIDGVL